MNQTFSAIIIDDEPLAVKRLKRLLENYRDKIIIIGEATNGKEGLEQINTKKPDVIFLDIEMPVMTGFEMLQQISYKPRIIFTTAFEEYAIKAFEENSIDYLLKPVETERLEKALDKLYHLTSGTTIDTKQLQHLMDSLQPKKEFKSFPVKVGDKILLIKPEEISYLEARDKYVFIVTDSMSEYITDFTLSSLEEKLPAPFMRVHRSFIINCDKIREIHKGFSGSFVIVMKDKSQTKIHTGRSYNEQVKSMFDL